MDQDVTLASLRAAIITYSQAQVSGSTEAAEDAAAEALGAFIALDSWLSMGGPLPVAWQSKQNGFRYEPESQDEDPGQKEGGN